MKILLELLVTAGIGWFIGRVVSMFFLPPAVPGAEEADTETREAYQNIVGADWFQKGIRKGVAISSIVVALVIRLLLLVLFDA